MHTVVQFDSDSDYFQITTTNTTLIMFRVVGSRLRSVGYSDSAADRAIST